MEAPPDGRRRKAAIAFIVVTIFLDVLGLGIVIPVLPHLVTDFLHGNASAAAPYFGLLSASFATMQFLFSPLLGTLSDRFGRRPVLLVALFGFGLNYLLMGWAPSLAWLFVARIFSGITGASLTTANAYIADISTRQNRAQNFGLVGAMFGLGFICGPALGGLLGHLGPRLPFFASAGVVFVNFFYGLFVLPESLPPERRRAFSLARANPLGGLLRLRAYPMVAGLAVTFVCMSLAQRGMESVFVLYSRYRYGWHELENGLVLSLVGVGAALVQGVLIRRIVPRLGERRVVQLGLVLSMVGYVLYGVASRSWILLVGIVLASFGGLAAPALQGLITGEVPPTEQGGVQGTFTSLTSLCSIVAPIVASQTFAFFTGARAPFRLPGAPFFVGVLFLVIGLSWVLQVFARHPTGRRSLTP